eukprot:NODE_814_length_3736_cov_0.382458.p1 type:complete len:389 gc:universal NODE_814_length_3736_cov_0.382458:3367-2201(-)
MQLHLVVYSRLYKHCVIGAGPAGLSMVANLLSNPDVVNKDEIAWISDHFDGGAMHNMGFIPGNAYAGMYKNWAIANRIFESIYNLPDLRDTQNKLKEMGDFEKPFLYIVHKLVSKYTQHVKGIVQTFEGKVDEINYKNMIATISIRSKSNALKCNQVYLAQGSSPKMNEPNVSDLLPEKTTNIGIIQSMNTKLDNKKKYLVVGNSHSGMLVLRNLYFRKVPAENVLLLYKSPHSYLRVVNKEYSNWNRALKGEAARFAYEILDKKKWNIKINLVTTATREMLKDIDSVIYATGFKTNPIPIQFNGEELNAADLTLNQETMRLQYGTRELPFYGLGIAYPLIINEMDENNKVHKVADVGLIPFERASKLIVQKVREEEGLYDSYPLTIM